ANKYGKDVANYLTSPASVYLTKNDASSSMGIYQEITDPEMVSRFIGKPVALSTNIKSSLQGTGIYGAVQALKTDGTLVEGK
ncbi:hypothetical protein, partial [Acinetobacter baumannii]|uniref:hypothetical protein n=1 Tax=Acinetobacter baumannii TaxID=470 RepID=UPI000A45E057